MTNYIRPAKCEQCIPVESYGDNTIEYAHETDCPNSKEQTK